MSKKQHEKDKDNLREASVDGIRNNCVCEEGGIKGYKGVLVNCLFFCCVPAPMRGGTFDNTCSGGNWGCGECGGIGRQGPGYEEKSTAWDGQEGLYGRRDGTGDRLTREVGIRQLSTAELAVHSEIPQKEKIRCVYVERNLTRTASFMYVRNLCNRYNNVELFSTVEWPISMRIILWRGRRNTP